VSEISDQSFGSFELSSAETKWWESEIRRFRKEFIHEPVHYAKQAIAARGLGPEDLLTGLEDYLEVVREDGWQLYLADEARFHSEVVSHLAKTREAPRELLEVSIAKSLDDCGTDRAKLLSNLSGTVGTYTGQIFPYLYQLSLSTTQSRRSRAGTTFEHLVEAFFDCLGYPYGTQEHIGQEQFKTLGLGKKVDLVVPSAYAYSQNRSKCAVVTMKTTLRERWQEVAEELSRTNVPHIYLLTLDRAVTRNVVTTMKEYNITLVVYEEVRKAKFGDMMTVMSLQKFFSHEVPGIIRNWEDI
jgi:hypothetical protein